MEPLEKGKKNPRTNGTKAAIKDIFEENIFCSKQYLSIQMTLSYIVKSISRKERKMEGRKEGNKERCTLIKLMRLQKTIHLSRQENFS